MGTLPGIALQATCLEVDCVVTLVARRVAAVLRFDWVVVERFLSWTVRTRSLAECRFAGIFFCGCETLQIVPFPSFGFGARSGDGQKFG